MFTSEKILVDSLKEHFNQMCDWNVNNNITIVSEEVDVGYGIADIVISKVKHDSVNTIYLQNYDIAVYNIVKKNKNITYDFLKTTTGLNDQVLKKTINNLMFQCYININNDNIYIQNEYINIVEKNIAIEAKLKNWKRALMQAYRYKWFANQSYVILDSKNIKAAINKINEFKKYNVGLAEISTDGVIKKHFKPKKEKPYSNNMTILFNERVKKELSHSKQMGSPSF